MVPEPGLILLSTNALGVSWLMAVTLGVTTCPASIPTPISVPVPVPVYEEIRPWAYDGRDLVARMPDLTPDELDLLLVVRDP